jgi:hypothetical protein
LLALEDRTLPSVLTVTDLTDSGAGSLRGTIAQAQSGDTIVFDNSLSGGTITLAVANGELTLQSDVTIQGLGAPNLTISGNNSSRVFQIYPGVNATISGLTITGGRATSSTPSMNAGGGIVNDGSLVLTDCVVTGNTVDSSGPITNSCYGGGIDNGGPLTLNNCTISNNTVTAGAIGNAYGAGIYSTVGVTLNHCTVSGNTVSGAGLAVGGGVYAQITSAGGALTLSDCTITNNTAITPAGATGNPVAQGGGVYVVGGFAPGLSVTLTRCTVSGNTVSSTASASGGGIYCNLDGTVTLSQCVVTGNTITTTAGIGETGTFTYALAQGGGFWLSASVGSATLSDCTFSNNSASANLAANTTSGGDGLALAQGGGVYCEINTTLTNCTLSGNTLSAHSPPPAQARTYGGGLAFQSYGSLSLTNCTVANNAASAAGSASASGTGGGLSVDTVAYATMTQVTLTNCTIAGNSANLKAGGLLVNDGVTANLVNTIVAGNTAPASTDIDGQVASQGYNLIGVTEGSTGWVATDLTGNLARPLDPLLGPLGDYGGPTQTLPLLAGSPALGAGTATGAPATDQRGVTRGGGINIGAYQASVSQFTLTAAPDPAPAGTALAVTVTATDSFGQTAFGYLGTVHFSATDPLAMLPADYVFTAADGGTRTFQVVLGTQGTVTLTVADLLGNPLGTLDVTVT